MARPRKSCRYLTLSIPVSALLCLASIWCPSESKAGVWKCYYSNSSTAGPVTCFTSSSCFSQVVPTVSSGVEVRQGCLSKEESIAHCKPHPLKPSGITCCRGNLCNDIQSRQPAGRKLLSADSDSLTTTEDHALSNKVTIAVVVVCLVILAVVLGSVLVSGLLCYLCCGRGGVNCREADLGAARNVFIGNRCSAIVPPGVTLSSMLRQVSPDCPSLSLLVQEAVVRRVVVDASTRRLEKFSESFLGRWRTERVDVRVYPELHEQIFYSESNLYQTPHLSHESVKAFIAAQNHRQRQSNVVGKYFLITEHHERGMLADHLTSAALDVHSAVLLARSAATGLAHLHREIRDSGGVEKEAIAHRNVTSRAFWVKDNGTCCLGDLSLAVKNDNGFPSYLKRKPLGHAHYLSPELLGADAQTLEGFTFEQLLKSDVYAFGLVLWEIARRCLIHGVVEPAELPFSWRTSVALQGGSSNPQMASLQQMKDIVLNKRMRPPLAEQWNLDEVMQSFVSLMLECWDDDPEARPSAASLESSLDKLLSTTSSQTPDEHKDTLKISLQQ